MTSAADRNRERRLEQPAVTQTLPSVARDLVYETNGPSAAQLSAVRRAVAKHVAAGIAGRLDALETERDRAPGDASEGR